MAGTRAAIARDASGDIVPGFILCDVCMYVCMLFRRFCIIRSSLRLFYVYCIENNINRECKERGILLVKVNKFRIEISFSQFVVVKYINYLYCVFKITVVIILIYNY